MTDAVCFPIQIRPTTLQHASGDVASTSLFADDQARERVVANLSITARRSLADLGVDDPDADSERAQLLWMHALAIGFAPLYLRKNADGSGMIGHAFHCQRVPGNFALLQRLERDLLRCWMQSSLSSVLHIRDCVASER